MPKVIEFECKKHGFRQTQDGSISVTLTAHPNDIAALSAFVQAPAGQRYMCVLAEVGDNEEVAREAPAEQEPCKPAKPKRPFHEKPHSVQAWRLCQDVAFWNWLVARSKTTLAIKSPTSCDAYLKAYLQIDSKSELDRPGTPRRLWSEILSEYETAAGRVAEVRG